MNKFFAKILCAGAFLALLAPVAKADSISGSVSIAGSDTFNSSSITFSNPSLVLASTVTGVTAGQIAALTSFSYNAASGVTLFSTTSSSGLVLSFIINQLTMVDLSTANFLNLAGTGTFSETGTGAASSTTGTFTLTSSTTGLTSFQLVGTTAATPEPNSLMLLGTGLISTAGMLVRRRRAANVA